MIRRLLSTLVDILRMLVEVREALQTLVREIQELKEFLSEFPELLGGPDPLEDKKDAQDES